jgi:hypothetical protein
MATQKSTSALRHAMFGRARTGRRPAGEMNKLERAYSIELEAQRQAGKILRWDYERITFVLVHGRKGVRGVTFTPDFMVLRLNGEVQFHETKGFRDEKNINKLKQAAELFPFRFFLAEHHGRKWRFQEM